MPREYTTFREPIPTVPLLYRGDTIHVNEEDVEGWIGRGAERPGAPKKAPKAPGGEGSGAPPAP